MLRIESIEIDDHILDKIESKHRADSEKRLYTKAIGGK